MENRQHSKPWLCLSLVLPLPLWAARLIPFHNQEVGGSVTASPHVHRELRTPSGASALSRSWMPASSRKGKSRGGGEPTVR